MRKGAGFGRVPFLFLCFCLLSLLSDCFTMSPLLFLRWGSGCLSFSSFVPAGNGGLVRLTASDRSLFPVRSVLVPRFRLGRCARTCPALPDALPGRAESVSVLCGKYSSTCRKVLSRHKSFARFLLPLGAFPSFRRAGDGWLRCSSGRRARAWRAAYIL